MLTRTLAAIGASALLLATPAFAQDEIMTVAVQIDDLNLASESGQARLGRRVFNAMRRICGEQPRSLDLRQAYEDCRSEVMADADQKIAALKLRNTDRIQVARRTR